MKNKKGFTLVELLVVVVVLGIITGLSIPLIRNIQESNREREYTTYMDSLKYSAKLYVDSYGEDLFGRHKSGCTLIKYKNMVDKGLLKDIPVDKVSCDSDETFVKVVKMDDKYGYASSIGCGNVKEGKVSIDKKLPKIGLSSSDVCSVDAKTIMSFIAKPAEDLSIKYKKHNIKLTIASDTGINDNIVVYYGFSYNKDSNVINNDWKKLPVTIPGKKSQKDDIYEGKTISITTDDLRTPSVTGELYLVLQIETLENLTSDSWTTDPAQDKFLYFGPYTVDNTKPKFNDSTVISSETGFNSTKPKLKLKVTDEKYSTVNDLRMCISYDTDTCSTKVTDIRNNSKYEKYNANKVLPAIQSGYDSSNHTVYVTVADAAGNYEKANYAYRLARRWTITYDSNGGNACNPTSKSLTFNNWESEPTWGELCKPTRTNYTFTGWNTKEDGTGTTITSDTKATKNITVYAQWRKNQVIFQYKMLDGGSITAQTKSDEGTVYNWTVNDDSYVYLNDKLFKRSYDYDKDPIDLVNYNNTKYLNITKRGYRGVPEKEWICIDGCKTKNQKFNQKSTSIQLKDICDYSKKDCTVTIKVNWEIINYTITYNLDGGSVTGNPTTYTVNSDVITLKNPTKTGYTFTGWTGTDLNSSTMNVTIPKNSIGNRTYTAHWRANVCKITYNPNSGKFTTNTTDLVQECLYDGNNKCTTDMRNASGGYYSATKSGYQPVSAKEWFRDGDSTKFNQANGYKATDFCPSLGSGDQNVTLKVNWEIVNYTISYTLDGGSVSGNPTTYNVNSDEITLKNPTKTGYTFTGWTGSNGTTVQTTVKIAKGSTGNKTYTANWRVNVCKITYSPNGGKFNSNADDLVQECEYKASGNCTNNMRNASGGHYSATKSGYQPVSTKEWFRDGDNTKFNQANGYKATDFCPNLGSGDQNVTLKVNWTASTFRLTYDSNGGSNCSPAYKEATYGSKWGTLCTPSKNNSNFDGWNTKSDGTGSAITADSTVPANNITAYAQWSSTHAMAFHYTGKFKLSQNGTVMENTYFDTDDINYKVWFLTSGRLTSYVNTDIAVFLAAGGKPGSNDKTGGTGGGVAYIDTSLRSGSKYDITIGGSNQNTTAFGRTANTGGGASGSRGVSIAEGAECPLNQYWMYIGDGWGKPGVYAWNDPYVDGIKYGCGGTGGGTCCGMTCCGTTCNGTGGAHDPACGDGNGWGNPHNGVDNTGGGGGGTDWDNGPGAGGSGVVIMRGLSQLSPNIVASNNTGTWNNDISWSYDQRQPNNEKMKETITCGFEIDKTGGRTVQYYSGYSTRAGDAASHWKERSDGTFNVSSTSFSGDRFYRCKAVISKGGKTEKTLISNNYVRVRISNYKVSFYNQNSLYSTLYARPGDTVLYDGVYSETEVATPIPKRSGYKFKGWSYWPNNLNGSIILNNEGNLTDIWMWHVAQGSVWDLREDINLIANWE